MLSMNREIDPKTAMWYILENQGSNCINNCDANLGGKLKNKTRKNKLGTLVYLL